MPAQLIIHTKINNKKKSHYHIQKPTNKETNKLIENIKEKSANQNHLLNT